jgi:hypothetical protein
MDSNFILWLRENIERLKQTSPVFFQVWNWINTIAILIAGIPSILTMAGYTDLNFLPSWILKAITLAAAWGLFMGKLTVQGSTPVAPKALKGHKAAKPCGNLPFTQRKEG